MNTMGPDALVSDPRVRQARRQMVADHPELRGIDYVDVSRNSTRAWTLSVHFIPPSDKAGGKSAIPAGITPEQVIVTSPLVTGNALSIVAVTYPQHGGRTLTMQAESSTIGDGVTLDVPMHLRIVESAGFDPEFSAADFYLSRNHGRALDPISSTASAIGAENTTDIDYLAKDYASFRRLMLDYLALHVPDWKERHPADIGVAIVEILAYAGDYLSYFQDAVATEAYLATSRRRTSVRRHARLLDYRVHEGCSARTWLAFTVDEDGVPLPAGFRVGALTATVPATVPLTQERITMLALAGRIFQTLEPSVLYVAHNQMRIYDWGVTAFTLPAGGRSAALLGHLPNLRQGDVIVFETRDIPPHAVRISEDPELTLDPVRDVEITRLVWSAADALPFPIPEHLSSVIANVVPADCGDTVSSELLPPIDDATPYRPQLRYRELTWSLPYDAKDQRTQPATAFFEMDPADAQPAIALQSTAFDLTTEWTAARDLVSSSRFANAFVVESEEDGTITLRFGDDDHGAKPGTFSRFTATYRIGNGPSGNFAADTITTIIGSADRHDERILSVRNPLPASGGMAPESLASVRQNAPEAFFEQRRCVTLADYADAAKRVPGVRNALAVHDLIAQRAVVLVYAQRHADAEVDDTFLALAADRLASYRIIGADFALRAPIYVPVDVGLKVGLLPGYSQNAVRAAVTDAIEALIVASAFTFGEPLYASALIARALEVEGVDDVAIERFTRWGEPDRGERAAGRIDVAPTEIIRLANDVRAPQRGVCYVYSDGAR